MTEAVSIAPVVKAGVTCEARDFEIFHKHFERHDFKYTRGSLPDTPEYKDIYLLTVRTERIAELQLVVLLAMQESRLRRMH